MKTTTFTAALMASAAVAQPHMHHRHQHQAKRDLVIEWETVWETATVIVDDSGTRTVLPTKTPEAETSGIPGHFFETPSPDGPPPAPSTYEASLPSTTTTPQAAPTTVVPEPEPTYETAPVVAPSPTTVAPPVDTYVPPAPSPPVETYTPVPPPVETYPAEPPAEEPPSNGPPSGGSNSGEITYYNVALGSCGYDDTGKDEKENIVAIPAEYWESISSLTSYGLNQPAHPLCDRTITIEADGKSVQAKIRDKCPGCSGMTIDVTPHAYIELFGSLDSGRSNCNWYLNEPL